MRRLCLGLLALTACSDREPVLLLPELEGAKSAIIASRSGGRAFSFVAFDLGDAVHVEETSELWLLSYRQSLSDLGLAAGPLGARVVGASCALLEPTVHIRTLGANWRRTEDVEAVLAAVLVEGRSCTNCIEFGVQMYPLATRAESTGNLSAVRALGWLSDGSVLTQQWRGLARSTPERTESVPGCKATGYASLSAAGPDRFWAWSPDVGEANLIEINLNDPSCAVLSSTVSPRFEGVPLYSRLISWPRDSADGFLWFSEFGQVDRFDGSWAEVGQLPEFQPGEFAHDVVPTYIGDEGILTTGGWERVSMWTEAGGLESELVGPRIKLDAVGHTESLGILASLGSLTPGIVRRDTGWQNNIFSDAVEKIRGIAPFRNGFVAFYDFGSIMQYDAVDGACGAHNDAQNLLGDATLALVSDSVVFVVARPSEPNTGVPRVGIWYTADNAR